MKTIRLMRTNGDQADVSFEYAEGDDFNSPSVFSLKTSEVEISDAKIMTDSDIELYAAALRECEAIIGGNIEGEKGIRACIRLDELSAAKLYREMQVAYEEMNKKGHVAVR